MYKTEEICMPEPNELEDKYHSAEYNCTECEQTDCFYWHLYHHEDVLID